MGLGRGGADSGLKVTPTGLLERDTWKPCSWARGQDGCPSWVVRARKQVAAVRDGGRNQGNGFS